MLELNLKQYTTEELTKRMVELNEKTMMTTNPHARLQMTKVIYAYRRELKLREGLL